MVRAPSGNGRTLAELVASRVHQSTHGRIRDLLVEEDEGRVMVRGTVPSTTRNSSPCTGPSSWSRAIASVRISRWAERGSPRGPRNGPSGAAD